MKRTLLFFFALLMGISGVWATDVTVIDKSLDATTYGSLSGETFTTNAASGMAGLTVSGIKGTTATSFAYGACLALTNTQNGTITITAPDGYNITGYSLTARSNTYSVPYTLTPAAGGSAVTTQTGGVSLSATGLNAQSTSFTYSAASANSFYIPSLTVTVVSATAQLVNVTYNLYDVGDMTTIKATETKTQEANSAISIPSSFVTTYFDYATEGTIGTEDCTIKVIRTLKPGYVISLDGFSNSKCYNIRNNRGTWAVGSGATVVNSTSELNLAFLASDTKQQFAFITYEGNVYLYSVGEGKFAYVDGTKLSLTDAVTSAVAASPVTLQESTSSFKNSEPIIVTVGGKMFGVSTGHSPDVYQYTSLSDGGNCAYIIEAGSFDATAALAALEEYFHPSYFVTYVVKDTDNNILYTSNSVGTTFGANITTLPSEYQRSAFYTYNETNVTISEVNTTVEFTATPKSNAPFKFTADATSPVWYFLTMRPDNSDLTSYPTYVAEGNPNVTLPPTSAQNNTTMWAFVGNPYAGFQIVNCAAGTSLVLGSANAAGDGADGGNTYATLAASGTQSYEAWTVTASSYASNGFFISNAAGQYLNRRNTANLAYWASGHDIGSTFVATECATLYDALIAQLEAIPFGTGLNQYRFTGSYAGYTEQAATIINGLSQGFTADRLAVAKELLANYALNMPQAGMFYRIKGNTSGKYLASGFASNNKFAMTDATDATTIFYYDGSKLVNYSDGMVNKLTGSKVNNVDVSNSGWNWTTGLENGSDVVFLDGSSNGGYAINSETVYLYDNGDGTGSADRGQSANISSENVRYRNWYLEEVTTLPITLNAFNGAYYSTFYSPVNVEVSEATAYTLTLKSNYLSATEISDGVIPANTGVVLVGASAAATVAVTDKTPSADRGVLTGTVATATSSESDYIFTVVDNEIGFYKNGFGTVKGFKAFYRPSDSSVRGFAINFGLNDAITDILHQVSPKNVYDLQGRRVNEPAKGLYIINGKKVIK